MREPSTPMQRLLLLRQFPTLATVELADLAMVADNATEMTYAPGAILAPRDDSSPDLHLVLDGALELRRGPVVETRGPRQVLGLLEVLAGRGWTCPAVATVETRTLRLGAGDTLELLEDNFGLLRAILRDLATRLLAYDRVLHGRATFAGTGEPLSLVERLIVMRQHAPFIGGHLQALAALASTTEDTTWPAGVRVLCNGAPPDHAIFVVEGTLASDSGAIVGAGDTLGTLEALAGARHSATVTSTTAVRAIVCPAASLLDILEDHTDLGLRVVGSLAAALLDRAATVN
jgi:CRP-like cAMP-binding protein